MTIRHMKIFIAVCENGGNTTKAAEQIFISQPAVSHAISEMEAYYGVSLFERISRKLYMTEKGEELYRHAKQIVTDFDRLEDRILKNKGFGILRAGCSNSSLKGYLALPRCVREFEKKHPDTEVKVYINSTEKVEEKLLRGELDFAIVGGMFADQRYVSEEFCTTEFVVIAAPGSPMALAEEVTLQELVQTPLLLREPECMIRMVLDSLMDEQGIKASVRWESVSCELLISAVKKNLGVGIVPLDAAQYELEIGEVKRVYVRDVELRIIEKVFISKEMFMTDVLKDFLELWRQSEKSEAWDMVQHEVAGKAFSKGEYSHDT